MGERLAKLLLLTIPLGGCSKLYDPERLSKATDAPRPPPDVFPCEMEVTDLATLELVEGAGTGGSLPALLVVLGKNLVNQNTSVTITPLAGTPKAPMLEIDSAKLEVGEYGEQLAVPITLPVDPTFPAGSPVAFDVTVAQDCIEGQKTATIPGRLTYRPLNELTDGGMTTPLLIDGGVHEFSQIDVVTRVITPGPNNKNRPIVLRSTSSVKIAKAISVNANATIGGNGAGNGGAGGSGLGGAGSPGTGPKPGLSSGNPGGFHTDDPGLTTLEEPNRGSGGAGGNGSALGPGGDGGGGGGSIEISAGGNLEVGAITARGAAGQGGAGGGAAGGGGSGGVIFLRAGGTLTAMGDIDVRSLGTGARGLARYDARGMAMVRPGETGTGHYRGPMVVMYPMIVRSPTPAFTVVGKPLESFQYFAIKQGGAVSAVSTALAGADGTARVVFTEKLAPGANQICVIPTPGTPTAETRNCVSIAYLQ